MGGVLCPRGGGRPFPGGIPGFSLEMGVFGQKGRFWSKRAFLVTFGHQSFWVKKGVLGGLGGSVREVSRMMGGVLKSVTGTDANNSISGVG
jgi:hypothetical protein